VENLPTIRDEPGTGVERAWIERICNRSQSEPLLVSARKASTTYPAPASDTVVPPATAITRVGHVALKSASPQVFFFDLQQCKLRFSEAQLRSLRFKLLDATFNCNFD
jgi:hypothetical protein